MIRLLMAVPVVSWILFAVLWFPGVEFRICFVLVVVCGPVFLIDTLDAMRGVPRELRNMLQSFRPTTLQFFRKLMLPAIVPTCSRAGRSTSAWPSASLPSRSWSAR